MPFQEPPRRPGDLKPMSAADNRQIDATLELATEFAQLTGQEPPEPVEAAVEPATSAAKAPRRRSERRVFSDEMASIGTTELTEAVDPQAQEAYNVLVVRGSGHQGALARPADPPAAAAAAAAAAIKSSRAMNMNIRAPQGIPGRSERRAAQQATPGGDDVETNPLRRLRDIHTVTPPRFRLPPANGDDAQDGSRLNANASFFAKLREQQQRRRDEGEGEEEEGGGSPTTPNEVPLPPRRSSRSSVGGAKPPRQRRFPLADDRDASPPPDDDDAATAAGGALHARQAAPPVASSPLSLSAADLGLFDSLDAFWGEDIDFEKLVAAAAAGSLSESSSSHKPDTSYEDLLDCALDESEQRYFLHRLSFGSTDTASCL